MGEVGGGYGGSRRSGANYERGERVRAEGLLALRFMHIILRRKVSGAKEYESVDAQNLVQDAIQRVQVAEPLVCGKRWG